MSGAQPWPTELRLNPAKDELTIRFDDQRRYVLSAEYLRVESPSAEVQGHSPDQRQTVAGKKDVKISRLEPIGNYAVRIVFDDGHDSGLYSWSYFLELGHEKDRKWAAYLEALKAKGLKRE
jgi:DUF971 family protein